MYGACVCTSLQIKTETSVVDLVRLLRLRSASVGRGGGGLLIDNIYSLLCLKK